MNLHTGPERPPEAESERGVAVLRPPADANAAFDRVTGHGADERRAMRLVFEAHGRIRTESDSSTGASFGFTLPLTAAEVEE